jgi:hypothetical protein
MGKAAMFLVVQGYTTQAAPALVSSWSGIAGIPLSSNLRIDVRASRRNMCE